MSTFFPLFLQKNRMLCAALIVVALTGVGHAEEPWTFERVIHQAASHPSILSKYSSEEAAKAELEGAEWQRFPIPSVEAGKDSHGYNTATIRLEQPLWTGGRITAGIDAADARLNAAKSGVGESQEEILLRIIAAYVEATRQQSRQEVMIKQVRRHESLLGMITRRVATEASPSVDQDLAQSRMHLAINELSLVTQQQNKALTLLSELVGEPVAKLTPVKVDGTNLPADREAMLADAMAQSPTLTRMRMEENAASADVDSKRSVFWPQLAARYENTSGTLSDERVMMVLSSQIGAGLTASSGVKSAQAKQRALQLSRNGYLRDLRSTLNVDWDELIAARLRLHHAELSKSGASEVFDSYTRQYTIGRKTWLDVMNAVREDTQAELAVFDAQSEINSAMLRIQVRTNRLKMNPVK